MSESLEIKSAEEISMALKNSRRLKAEKWVSLESLKLWLKSNAKIECYQCEKCGFIDAYTYEEFKAMPLENQRFLLEHRQKCGGRFLPFKVVPLNLLLSLLEGESR